MLREIDAASVCVALVNDFPLDGCEDLRFSRTHPLYGRDDVRTLYS